LKTEPLLAVFATAGNEKDPELYSKFIFLLDDWISGTQNKNKSEIDIAATKFD